MAATTAPVIPAGPQAPPVAPPRTIGELAAATPAVKGDAPGATVVRLFEHDPGLDSVAVLDGPRIGLVTRGRLFAQLGSRFGYAVFENRPVRLLMEEGSTVDAAADPLEVITLATQREQARICDDIVVVDGGRYVGTVSIRSLLVHHKDLLAASMAEVDARNRRLEELQRAQSQLVAELAGELRGPLLAMLDAARAAALDPALPEAQARAMDVLLERSRGLLAAVDATLQRHLQRAGAAS